MSTRQRLAVNLIAPVTDAARAAGLDVDTLLRAAGIDPAAAPATCTETAGHIDVRQYFRLWECAITGTGLPHLALPAARACGTGGFGVLGFACMTSETIGGAFANLVRYGSMLNGASRWWREDEAGQVSLHYEIAAGPPLGRRAAVEFALAEVLHCANLMAAQTVPVSRVDFPHAPPADEEPYRRHFGAPVRWRAPQAALILAPSALEIPLLKADPSLRAYFVDRAKALMAAQAAPDALSARVQHLLTEALPAGAPTVEQIAGRLAMSPRSLRRHLAAQGTSYQKLVEQTRRALAERYLQDSALSISDIAQLVGFSEPSPFQRAFRRWTKVSPSVYRERAGL